MLWYASCGIVRKHTCNVRRQLRRRSAHGAKRVLLVSLRAPAFSPLVYLCKYSPSIYNNTRGIVRAAPVVVAAHATAICHVKLPSSPTNCEIIK